MFDKNGNYTGPGEGQGFEDERISPYIRASKICPKGSIAQDKKAKGVCLQLEKFDFVNNLKPMSNFLVIGKRNTGKTNLLKGLLYYLCRGGKNGIGKVAVLSGSELENPQYRELFGIPVEFIRPEPDVGFIKRIMDMQSNICSSVREETGVNKVEMKHGLILVLDDLVYDQTFMKSTVLDQIMFNGRQRMIGIVVLTQEALGTKSRSRSNYDYVISFRLPSKREIACCYDNYFPAFETIHDFKRTMMTYTENYGFIIADNTNTKSDASQQYFRGRFPNLDKHQVMFKFNYSDTAPYLKYLSGLSDEDYEKRPKC